MAPKIPAARASVRSILETMKVAEKSIPFEGDMTFLDALHVETNSRDGT